MGTATYKSRTKLFNPKDEESTTEHILRFLIRVLARADPRMIGETAVSESLIILVVDCAIRISTTHFPDTNIRSSSIKAPSWLHQCAHYGELSGGCGAQKNHQHIGLRPIGLRVVIKGSSFACMHTCSNECLLT